MFINRFLIEFAEGSKKYIFRSIFIQLFLTLLTSGIALLTSLLIHNMLMGRSVFSGANGWIVTGIFAALIILALLTKQKTRVSVSCGVSIKDNVRSKLMQKLFLMGPAYTVRQRTGVLTSLLTTRTEWLMNYYTVYLPVVVSAILNAALFTVFLFRIDFWTGIVALLSIVAMVGIPMFFFRIMKSLGEEEWDAHGAYYSDSLDGIQGMTSLKILSADDWYVERIKVQGERFRKAIMAHLRITVIEGTFSEFFARTGSALTVAILALRFAWGFVEVRWIITAFFSIGAAFAPMMALINAWHMGFQGVSSSYSIGEFLNQKVEYALKNSLISKDLENLHVLSQKNKNRARDENERDKAGQVDFHQVDFRYPFAEDMALQGIHFSIQPGKTVALVGHSGSGKSTIANLLAGFYCPTRGRVSLNETVLSQDTVGYFQSQIAAVWQDSHLFVGSIYENILMGRVEATEEEVHQAAREAMIHDFICSLPRGYQTQVGEQGERLSTGERQRIAIARALLKDAPILIFDEATSALDRRSEKLIQKSFDRWKKGKTVLIIAHRLQTILQADEIIVLQQGRIAHRGNHQTLCKDSALYRELMGGQLHEDI